MTDALSLVTSRAAERIELAQHLLTQHGQGMLTVEFIHPDGKHVFHVGTALDICCLDPETFADHVLPRVVPHVVRLLDKILREEE